MKQLSHIILLFLLFFSCKENTPEIPAAALPPSPSETIALFFKKEKRIEIWSSGSSKQLLETLKTVKLPDIEIGIHDKVSESFFRSNNYISKKSSFEPSKILTFPNDPRSSGKLSPCFACSHSTVETYAKLELLIKDYTNIK